MYNTKTSKHDSLELMGYQRNFFFLTYLPSGLMYTLTKGTIMKTHIIKDDGTVNVVKGKIEDLAEMQALVKGPIEIVNAAMPDSSQELPGSESLKEMVVNEEGLFNNSFKTNEKARKLIAEGLGVKLHNIQDICGDVFVTDGWRIA